jgi:hypothetical protein
VPDGWDGFDTIERRLHSRYWRDREILERDDVEVLLDPDDVAAALVVEMQPNPYGRQLPAWEKKEE